MPFGRLVQRANPLFCGFFCVLSLFRALKAGVSGDGGGRGPAFRPDSGAQNAHGGTGLMGRSRRVDTRARIRTWDPLIKNQLL